MRKLTVFLLLFVIILLGIITRGYKLGEAPAGLYIDEAGQGYSAYSILKTGKDEFGKTFPIVFRSFTDFKTPVYIYLIVPLIPIFDLTSFTVRLPSFIFSILTLPIIFLLIRKISPKKVALPLALLTTLLLAISPWHVLFGRTNFECNVALFFFLAGVLAFYKALEKPIFFIPSALLFAIAIPAYHSQRIVTPLMLLFLLSRHRKKIFSKTHPAKQDLALPDKKYAIAGFIIGLLLLLPTLSVALTPGFLARAGGLNIFSYGKHPAAGYLSQYDGFFGSVVNNPIFLSSQEFGALYLSYLSPRNMFILGDYGPRSSFPELGTFFIWQFPFYLYGLYLLLKKRELGELRALTLAFLLIAPIPAAVTRDPYSTIRALPLVVPQLIIISLGILFFIQKLGQLRLARPTILLFIGVFTVLYSTGKLYSSGILLNEYFRPPYWDYGWKEVVKTLDSLDPNLPIIVDNARSEPYIELLFLKKFDPEAYQRQNHEVSPEDYYTKLERITTVQIGNIITRGINWEDDLLIKQYLVGDALFISEDQIERHNLTKVAEIKFPDKNVAFRVVETNP
ncbi:MAG: glycosyltransferase family 39 protein [bacterium]|nr:glycosyltransferase family 39 protein [bacterium]